MSNQYASLDRMQQFSAKPRRERVANKARDRVGPRGRGVVDQPPIATAIDQVGEVSRNILRRCDLDSLRVGR
jgi:hypothetical protein